MDLSNTRVPESFTIYRNFIHFRQPARPPPVRSEQLRPCRQKPKTQRVRRPARSGGGRAQGEPRCKPERGSRKCAWAMWRCRRRTQEAEAKALRRRAVGLFAKRPGEKTTRCRVEDKHRAWQKISGQTISPRRIPASFSNNGLFLYPVCCRHAQQLRAQGRQQKRCGAGWRPFCKMAWRKNFQPAPAGKGSRHPGSSIGSAQCTRADCLFW